MKKIEIIKKLAVAIPIAGIAMSFGACGSNDASNDATSETTTSTEAKAAQFPTFEGKDLDGNPVDNAVFTDNKVTVVNIWYAGCSVCMREIRDLEALNQDLQTKGGSVIGINTDTVDGRKGAVEEAKEIMETKGASYRNIYFSPSSEAASFAFSISAYPTTYVIDGNGNIVGDEIVGSITYEKNAEKLNEYIEKALSEESN